MRCCLLLPTNRKKVAYLLAILTHHEELTLIIPSSATPLIFSNMFKTRGLPSVFDGRVSLHTHGYDNYILFFPLDLYGKQHTPHYEFARTRTSVFENDKTSEGFTPSRHKTQARGHSPRD
jgi:hypothetical protein